ncbi:MAG: hypothetical protein GY759_18655 [Chloroflexi bacterium]|nr:hypothetical protein [Chloroflexota bacterium]
MPNETMIMTLAKVLIAAAWADGELTLDEINAMKDLLFRIPELNAREWASIEIYMTSPVDGAERQRLVYNLAEAISSAEGKQLALDTLDDMILADGIVTDDEQRAIDAIKREIEGVDVGTFSSFSQFFRGRASRRQQSAARAPNREIYLEDYMRNRIYYDVRRRLDLGEAELDVSDDELRRLSLAGGMMAQVARVNPQVTDSELQVMADSLQMHWQLSHDQAAFVAGVAITDTAQDIDSFRLAREFSEAYSYEESAKFLNVLFTIAGADGHATVEEVEEIHRLAGTLKLSQKTFITAKKQYLEVSSQ